MNRFFYITICLLIIFSGCRKNKDPDPTQQIYDLIHGKYKVISSTSNEAVDVNLDGTASTNIMAEIPDVEFSTLLIRITSTKFFLGTSWPEQHLGYGVEPTGYDPSVTVIYATQGVLYTFTVDTARSKIQVNTAPPPPGIPRLAFPESVTIESTGRIQIVFSKKLYTRAGWKTVTITTMYERYTMET